MVTYGDYFPRKVLYNCGVSPDRKLFENGEMAYTGMQRIEKIHSDMSEIYQTLYRGHTEKNAGESKVNFADYQVERRIVSAFYDSGVLSNAERDYFQSQTLQNVDERERICVEEANILSEATKSNKVDAPIKMPVTRNIRQ